MLNSTAKFLPFCEPLKLENELSASKIQSWYKHMIIVINVLDPKGRNWKEERSNFSKQFWYQGRWHLISRSRNNLWLESPLTVPIILPSGFITPPLNYSSFLFKVSKLLQLNDFVSIFPAYRIFEVLTASFISTFLCPF